MRLASRFRAVGRRLRSERGYSLIEAVVVMALAVLVVGAPLAFILLSLKQQNATSSRAVAATQEETGLQRLTRDLRQAVANTASLTWSSTSATATMTIDTPGSGGGSTESVTWSCSFGNGGSCTRQVNSGTAVTELSNVESLSFSPLDTSGNSLGGSSSPYSATDSSSDPIAYVGITIQVLDLSQLDHTSAPSHAVPGVSNAITVRDGVSLRDNAI